nr:unnamed protein product [Callosobruchus analis]
MKSTEVVVFVHYSSTNSPRTTLQLKLRFCTHKNQTDRQKTDINFHDQFLAYEKRIAKEKWLSSSCATSGLLAESGESDSPDDENVENPSNGKILKVLNSKFAELEKAITFNGDMMEQLQQTIKVLTKENKKK